MKILFDNKIFINQINGGPSVYFINLIKNIREINNDTKISSYIHLSNMLRESDLKNTGYKLPLNNKLVQYNFLKKFLHKINNYNCNIDIKRFDPDILHTTYYENYKYIVNKKLKKIVTVFDLINEKFNETFYRKKLKYQKKKILDVADKIICISNNTKKDLLNFYDVDEKKISVIHLGYPKKQTNLKRIFNFPYILFVGTRWKYKNFDKLLEAISISKQIRDNFFLITFGGGKFNNYEKKLIKKYNLDKIIQTDGNDEK